MAHKSLYIVDNSDKEQSVKEYVSQWCGISKQMDIATGYFEVGGLLALDEAWQKLDKIRILLGSEVTKHTKDVIDTVVEAMLGRLKESIDEEQEKNEFLIGIPAIVEAMKRKKIECRVYTEGKFHAKAYITYFRDDYKEQFISGMNVPDGYALVGSSNFTRAGLTKNIELNVQVKDNVDQLQDWFEERWNQGEDITDAVLHIIEEHSKEYSPYDVYLRSMYEFFKGQEETVSEWESKDSVIYPMLSQYQKDGYNSMVSIASRYSGAFLCDGVGLGKTFEGLMVVERFVKKERKNVVLIVPASARISVWETTIKKYIPEILEGFYPFKIINHTDLLLDKNQNLMQQIANQAEVVVIDEAHHFRNRASNRYKKLFDMMASGPQKQMFMLTATPINNSFLDLQHLIELFTHRQEDYFAAAPLGIHSLSGHFRKMQKALDTITGGAAQDTIDTNNDIFRKDMLVQALVVQRSRAYVKSSLKAEEGAKVLFSVRMPPIVANYSLAKSYGKLIEDFTSSFRRIDKDTKKPITILSLPIYSPFEDEYYIGDESKKDDMVTGRQQQIVILLRQLMLKRFESSVAAFLETCAKVYIRLRMFMEDYKSYGNQKKIDRLFAKHEKVWEYISNFLQNDADSSIEDVMEDLPDYIWESDPTFSVEDFNIAAMLDDTELDLDVLADFIKDMMDFKPENDDKLRELKRILQEDPHILGKKVIIFSEYRATALYIYKELQKAGFKKVYEVDGQTKGNLHNIVKRFSPYYNDTCSADIQDEINILIATDVLSEGINLQDASCLINYELHWNPVRLMQRIGRVDRRRNASIEAKMLADHPKLAHERENAYYWNFLPPDELNSLLSLYKTVTKKTLAISKTFGIEGKQLLTPDDDYDALKDFNESYEGSTSALEQMALAYQELLAENPGYLDAVAQMPKKIFSGRMSSRFKGFFFCYELPVVKADGTWSNGDGLYRWYLLDTENGEVYERVYEAWELIRCEKNEPRMLAVTETAFETAKKTVDGFIKKNYMRQVSAPMGVKPRLVTWLQLN